MFVYAYSCVHLLPAQSFRTSQRVYRTVVASFLIFGIVLGVLAGLQPAGAGWRLFSWHPFFMVMGMAGIFGPAFVTKKMGGYDNTKVSLCRCFFHCSVRIQKYELSGVLLVDRCCSLVLLLYSVIRCYPNPNSSVTWRTSPPGMSLLLS